MKKEKQKLVLQILKNGKYKVESDGILYSYRKITNEWKIVKGSILPTGYIQYIIHDGKNTGLKSVVYGHILSYLFHKGTYKESNVINHKDLNKLNNAPNNLESVSIRKNVIHSRKNKNFSNNGKYLKLIRNNEIKQIREKLALNLSSSKIALELGLNRVNVTRIVNKIKNNEPLKYDLPPNF